MNYLTELKAFYDQLELNPLSTSAIAVWHALMYICNKVGWPDEFTVAVSIICLKAGTKERAFYNARNELKQKGYLTFQSRRGNQAAIYTLTPLSAQYAGKLVDNDALTPLSAQYADKLADNDADKVVDSASPLIKQNKTINKTKHNNPFRFYEENGFGLLSPFVRDDITAWLEEGFFEEPEAVVIEAMKRAIVRNVCHWRYVSRILQNWQASKLTTIEAILAADESHHKRVTPFPQAKKGGERHDKSKRLPSSDYTGYDFGF
ncbi:DnaD domain protein [Alkalihalobacillus oceani]|uniref:DnaD domain protein n=1 Tax=Halalkalibacter oceani TaxID=1653776 RepID=UPI00203F5AB0|nr:DnaD domain protein [Halalkalibacter oceani]MCM3761839.1 DnaD domain protein [Halalkalibacter oceani]